MSDKTENKVSRGADPENLDEHIEKMLALPKPDPKKPGLVYQILKRYFDPQLLNTDRLTGDRPTMYVGNHTLMGFEGGFIPPAILQKTGKLPRLLTDSMAMNSAMGERFLKMGQVLANRKVCRALHEAGEDIMVFPGGAREAMTKKGEAYMLKWGGRTGFVSMAIELGYTITPVASVGPEDMWDVLIDGQDIDRSPLGKLLKRQLGDDYNPELLPSIPRGMGLSILPRPERFYINFGKPIDLTAHKGKEDDNKFLRQQQGRIAAKLNKLIKETLTYRSQNRSSMPWLRRRLTRY